MNQRLSALKFVTASLALDPSAQATDALRGQIRSGDLPWEDIVELANNHLLTPALWAALKERGLVDELPSDLVDYLRELHKLSTERNQHLLDQLTEAVAQLNRVGIVPVLLKGAVHLVSGMYTDRGARIMSDIDLLVAPAETDNAYSALWQLGYRPDETTLDDYGEDHHHCAPLFRPGDFASIEIHRGLMDGYAEILAADEALAGARSVSFNGLAMKMLAPTHRVLHNILHSQLVDGHYVHGVIPLRSLSEVTVEDRKSPVHPDWLWIRSRMVDQGKGRVLRAYLYMANRLYGMPYPAGMGKSPGSYIYFLRCCAQLAWDWFDIWGVRFGRFSADNIRRLYGCGGGFVALNQARLRHLCRLLTAYVARRYDRSGRYST